ncbi:MAG: hypothetical protein WDM76_12960 [Limisphaerales bacterium]
MCFETAPRRSLHKKIRRAINQNIAHIGPFGRGGENQASGQIRRQIFQTVNREIGFTGKQGDFEFFREQTFGQSGTTCPSEAVCFYRLWS